MHPTDNVLVLLLAVVDSTDCVLVLLYNRLQWILLIMSQCYKRPQWTLLIMSLVLPKTIVDPTDNVSGVTKYHSGPY